MAANPLVAERVDSTQWYSGLGIVESINDTAQGIESGSWIEATIGGVGTGLDALGLIVDPVGSVVSWSISWLMEHVQPLSDALDWLAGDPDQISANSHTWKNVGQHVTDAAQELRARISADIAEWSGEAAQAYRFHAQEHFDVLSGIARGATGIGNAVQICGVLVAAVREIVRDLIAECIATLAIRLPQWLAEIGLTVGIGTAWVVGQVATLIAKWVKRIGKFLEALIKSMRKLAPLLRHLDELIESLKDVLRRLSHGSPDAPPTRKPDADSDGMPDAFDTTPHGNLTDADNAALADYTGANAPGAFRDINGYLRDPNNPRFTPEERAALQARADAVSTALDKLPAQPGTTYRGVDYGDNVLDRYEPGQVVTEHGFTSTSRNPNVATGDFEGNTLMVITGQNGRDVAPFAGRYSDQAETLYDQGTSFRVIDKRWDPDLQKWIVVMEEVSP